MSAFRKDENREGEVWGPMDSDAGRESVTKEGEERLHELTADFLSSRDPNSPDPQLVAELYMATFQNIVRHFERGANDRSRAEDAAQEGFKALQAFYENHKALPDRPMAFLLEAARNWLINKANEASSRRNVSLGNVDSSMPDLRPDAREPFEAVASAEIKEAANAALEELDETTRKIIELHREDNSKPWDEIAEAVGLPNGGIAREKFYSAVSHVRGALGRHFSSFVAPADRHMRRFINSRKSAEQAIDLLPPPYDKILNMLLVKKMTEKEIAARLGVSLEEVKRNHERALEHVKTMYDMTEDELLDVLWHGR